MEEKLQDAYSGDAGETIKQVCLKFFSRDYIDYIFLIKSRIVHPYFYFMPVFDLVFPARKTLYYFYHSS